MNRGDSALFKLELTINNSPITQDYPADIELTINTQEIKYCVQKSLKDETIYWDNSYNCFMCYLSQEDTFKLFAGNNSWQIRMLANDDVVSTDFGILRLGEVNSKEVLT